MISLLGGIGFLLDGLAFLFVAFRFFGPTKSTVGLSPRSFRGSLLWFFFFIGLFTLTLGITLLGNDLTIAALVGYVIGHVFLYLSFTFYIYAPFSIIKPENKKIPTIFAIVIFITGMIFSYINWTAYANKSTFPEVGANGVVVWNPPFEVFAYIVVSALLILGIFGAGLFLWHSRTSPNAFLRKRSKWVGIGFLLLFLSGPPHDIPNISPYVILLADIFGALGALAQGYALTLRREND